MVVPSTVMVQDADRQSEVLGLEMPLNSENIMPGDKMPVAGVHPSFDLSQARPSSFLPKVGGMDFLADGIAQFPDILIPMVGVYFGCSVK
jgi:cytochrome c